MRLDPRLSHFIAMVVLGVALLVSAVVWTAPFASYARDLSVAMWLLYAVFVIGPIVIAVALALVLWRPILPDLTRSRLRAVTTAGTQMSDVISGIRGEGEQQVVATVRRLDMISVLCQVGDVGCTAQVVGMPGESVECGCGVVRRFPEPEVGVFAVADCPSCQTLTRGDVGAVARCPRCSASVQLPNRPASATLASTCGNCVRPLLGEPGEAIECPGCGKAQQLPREVVAGIR